MELTLAQICSTATAFNQGRLDYTLSECSYYANIALSEVATRIQHRPLEALAVSSTTSGGTRISLPSDFAFPINVTLSGTSTGPVGSPVQLMIRESTWIDSESTVLGVPRYYAPYSDWIELAPSPDSSYSVAVRYGKKVPAMLESTSTPGINERFHPAVMYKTAELLAAARNDLDMEAISRARYLSYMQSTPTDNAYRHRATEGISVAVQRNRR
jgi:hypothetical protein